MGGRPKKLTAKDIAAAKAMLADGTLTSKEISAKLGVSKATLYRHLS
jgi:AcrR family transcriptional regulator